MNRLIERIKNNELVKKCLYNLYKSQIIMFIIIELPNITNDLYLSCIFDINGEYKIFGIISDIYTIIKYILKYRHFKNK